MPKNNKIAEKRFSDYIENIQSDTKVLLEFNDVKVQAKAGEILANANELTSALRGMRNILVFSLIITIGSVLIAVIFGTAYYNDEVVGTPGNIEKKILYPNNEITLTYLERDGKVVSYQQLSSENDSLTNQNIKLQDSLFNTKLKLDLAIDVYDIEFKKTKVDNVEKWSIKSGVVSDLMDIAKDGQNDTRNAIKLLEEYNKELKNTK